MSCTKIVQQRPQHHRPVNQNVPIHFGRNWQRCCGKERKDERDHEKQLRGNVDRKTPSPQAELGREEGLVRDAPPDHAPDGTHVAGEQRRCRQRGDGVESRGRADVDQGEEACDDNGCEDGIQR